MKIRIKGNSIRYRLSRSEVTRLAETGYLEEQTIFPKNRFLYALQMVGNQQELTAEFTGSKISIYMPASFVKDWPANNTVGIDCKMALTETDSLYLLVEKDFICLDETSEDQSDNYENPNKSC